ncbi:hypothetical protein NDU88_002164 [Pleurodeles waltl]|uniref:Uncharacterized protein n=1 Tax=Pleurodeles waltl TaxID=8319 RepID=A0AAV7TMH1_PLEWA|nr:hypothetical protein NDU88_002164 [Pleurodeles waltl]
MKKAIRNGPRVPPAPRLIQTKWQPGSSRLGETETRSLGRGQSEPEPLQGLMKRIGAALLSQAPRGMGMPPVGEAPAELGRRRAPCRRWGSVSPRLPSWRRRGHRTRCGAP